MRINQCQMSFKSYQPQNTTKPVFQEVAEELNLQDFPDAGTLKAYAISNTTGLRNSTIRPDYDAFQLVYRIKSPAQNTQSVKFIYSTDKGKTQREVFSSDKDKKTGTFKMEIPVLDRKKNTLISDLTILGVEYFDEENRKTNEERPENYNIKPDKILKLQKQRYSTIDGVTTETQMDSISEGVSHGKLVEKEYEDMVRYKGSEPIITILSQKDMNELFMEIVEGTFSLPMNVKGIIASPKGYRQGYNIIDCLGHAVSRLRGRKTFALVDENTLESIKKNYLNNPENPYIKLELNMDKINVTGEKQLPKVDETKVKLPKNSLVNKLLSPEDKDFTQEAVGLKAFNLGKLKKLQQEGEFKVPSFFVVPAGVWDYTKKSSENVDIYGDTGKDYPQIGTYHFYTQKADLSENPYTELNGIRNMIVNELVIPKETRTSLKEKTAQVFDMEKINNEGGCLIARSSFNGEDSDTIATQGLYDSFPGIRTSENLFRCIKEVWASKWSDLAYKSRREHKIPHRMVQPNVIIQEVVPVDYTFTINTADPRSNDKNKIVCQLSQGVYSGFPNSPYIFEYDKSTDKVTRTVLATKKRTKPIKKVVIDDIKNEKYELTDYSNDPLNMSKKQYTPIMKKVFDVAKFIEAKFDGKPQDIEGGIIFKKNDDTGELEPEIHIWQTRDVHLIKR